MPSLSDKAIQRLEVGAVEDLTYAEIDALLEEIRELRKVATMFDNVMSTLNVDYEDMFPEEE